MKNKCNYYIIYINKLEVLAAQLLINFLLILFKGAHGGRNKLATPPAAPSCKEKKPKRAVTEAAKRNSAQGLLLNSEGCTTIEPCSDTQRQWQGTTCTDLLQPEILTRPNYLNKAVSTDLSLNREKKMVTICKRRFCIKGSAFFNIQTMVYMH